MSEEQINEIILYLNDGETTWGLRQSQEIKNNAYSKVDMLKELSDEEKVKIIERIEYSYFKLELITSLSNDNLKIDSLDQIDKNYYLDEIEKTKYKAAIIKSMSDEDLILLGIESLESEYDKERLIQEFYPDDISKIECFDRVRLEMTKSFLMTYLSNNQLKIENLSKIKSDTIKSQVIASLDNDQLKIECLKQLKNDDIKKSNSIMRAQIRNSCNIETIRENLDLFIAFETDGSNAEYLKTILAQMEQKNDNVLKQINFDMLKPQYVKTLGIDRINIISCFPNIQNQILDLDFEKYKAFILCLKEYLSQQDKTKISHDWTSMVELFLNNIQSYDQLIQNLKGKEYDSNKLYMLIQNPNDFEIKTADDLENYEEIIKSKCDELITHENIEDKRLAVLQKIFGQNPTDVENLIRKYGQDINFIENQDLKDYVKCLKAIMSAGPNELNRIYREVQIVEKVHKLSIERSLKFEYGKQFNDGLFCIDKDQKYDGKLVDAGTDFKMLITSVSAFVKNDIINNEKENWNKRNLASPHFCTSYIRNDMISTAFVPKFCYGFNEMAADSLAISGSEDLYANETGFTSKARIYI